MPILVSCPSCSREWTGTVQAHCTICHEHFSTVANFDTHRPGPRRKDGTPSCGKPADITRRKRDGSVVPMLKSVSTVHGPLWVSWSDDVRHDAEEEAS